jgi:hypothetical protein
MFIVAIFTITKLLKEARCPTTDEWIKNMCYLYTMEFYSAIKKKKILSFAGKCVELQNIILTDISLRKSKAAFSPSYPGYRPTINTAIVWNIGHT